MFFTKAAKILPLDRGTKWRKTCTSVFVLMGKYSPSSRGSSPKRCFLSSSPGSNSTLPAMAVLSYEGPEKGPLELKITSSALVVIS